MAADLMVIAAHPDDAEIGMGGTIARCLAAGREVVVVDLSDGEPTPLGSPEIRARERAAASEILGLTERRQLGLVNREITDSVENRKLLAAVIREYQPRQICAPYPRDAHPDHLGAAALVTAARFYAKFVKSDLAHSPHYPARLLYYFCIHLRFSPEPDFLFDTSEFIDQKLAALAAYRSQFGADTRNSTVLDRIKAQDHYWGLQINTEFAEPFVCPESLSMPTVDALLSC